MVKSKILVLDTSAILSGKPLNFENEKIITTENILNELKPGGRDYQNLQFLKEKGLIFQLPSKNSIEYVVKKADEIGDKERLSSVDIEILSLAYELSEKDDSEVVILTDDYSIQNTANHLGLKYECISQEGITKKFKWVCRCRGCGKKFKDNISICPICGADTKKVVIRKKDI